jgi:hypothetical protein
MLKCHTFGLRCPTLQTKTQCYNYSYYSFYITRFTFHTCLIAFHLKTEVDAHVGGGVRLLGWGAQRFKHVIYAPKLVGTFSISQGKSVAHSGNRSYL